MAIDEVLDCHAPASDHPGDSEASDTLSVLTPDQERELALEQDSIEAGINDYRKRCVKAEQHDRATTFDYGRTLLAQAIEPVVERIKAFIDEAYERPGRRHHAVKFIELFQPEVVALVTARVILDGIVKCRILQDVAIKIGGRLEDEHRFRRFEEERGGLFHTVNKNFDEGPWGYNTPRRRSTLIHAMNKFSVAVARWTQMDRLHTGMKCIDLFVKAGDWVTERQRGIGRETRLYLEPTKKLLEWITARKLRGELLCPQYMPMLCPPRPWASPSGGGYLHSRLQQPLVKGRKRAFLNELQTHPMPDVYRAVNALQATAWKVNGPMLTVLTEVWEGGLVVKGLPPREPPPLPAKPGEWAGEEAWKRWKAGAAEQFRATAKSKGKLVQAGEIIRLARRFAPERVIYFPTQMDFRGRMYPIPQFLNPQGSDMAKSLLTFAHGKPLGKDGVFWLAVHLANHFGHDKVSLGERAAWAHQHSASIRATASDPLGDRWWTEADKPFQFLAAAIEWVGYLTKGGEAYECSLPILVDGSCNGLQHFSAMLRDEVCGAQVNLIPSPKPADIYQAVADDCIAELRHEAEKGTEYAAGWLAFRLTRMTCKQPVMVLPYGGTREAFRKHLLEHVRERGEAGEPHPFGRNLNKAVLYLTKLLERVMRERVKGPRLAMDWLRSAAKVIGQGGKTPIRWTTPSGFLVEQAYLSTKRRRVETRVGDRTVYVSVLEDVKGKLDGRRQARSISPNFVHSMDASALVLTINACLERGITQFAAIHDSYGTLAADMGTLQKTLRQQFVSMYENNDVLGQLAASVPEERRAKMPPVPCRGSLNLHGVLDSEFFFA